MTPKIYLEKKKAAMVAAVNNTMLPISIGSSSTNK
jgi:hypothetical protein